MSRISRARRPTAWGVREDDPSDRWVVLNVLTSKGEQIMERLQRRSDDELQRVVGGLSADEPTEIAQSLTRLNEVLTPAA